MGKGKQKGRQQPTVNTAADLDDDELLKAAIAENKATLEKAALEKKRVQAEQEEREAACARRDQEGAPLSREAICSLMDTIPCFCIVDAQKQFVPLRVQGITGTADDTCMAWTEPLEAQSALEQAKKQRPSAELAIATLPLGKAFALSEGWAEAQGVSAFRVQAHSRMVQELRPQLTQQLKQQGMPTGEVFPVFMWEELTTDTVMPVFLSRAEIVATWQAVQKQRGNVHAPPPSSFTVMDLRILVRRMQSGGVDWSIIRFVGTDRAFELVKEGQRQEAERGEAEPPPLEPDR